jgi:hypothetical protein
MLEVRAETHEGLPVNCALSSDFNQKWEVLAGFNKTVLFILFRRNLVNRSGVNTYIQTDIAQ